MQIYCNIESIFSFILLIINIALLFNCMIYKLKIKYRYSYVNHGIDLNLYSKILRNVDQLDHVRKILRFSSL